MSGLERFEPRVWDTFFDFLYSEETLTRMEVQEELKRLNIDVSGAVNRVRLALKQQQAKATLVAARAKRVGLAERMQQVVTPHVDSLRDHIRSLVAARFTGEPQLVYFRKLEEISNEQDLKSLLEDIQRLDLMEEGRGDAGAQ